MRVLVIVRADDDTSPGGCPDGDAGTGLARHTGELVKAGVLLASAQLQPGSKPVLIRFAGGSRSVIDDPPRTAGHGVTAIWLWQVSSIDEAIQWAKRCPLDDGAEIEIRAVATARG
jgi:hypothetical protein